MKTSFYFVVWILIYPVLGLLNSQFVDNNAFMIALVAVWGITWLLNRLLPDTIAYERSLEALPIMEDVFRGNVNAVRKRVANDAAVETITAVYFVVTLFVIASLTFSSIHSDWFGLIIFTLFSFGAISRSARLLRANAQLRENPGPEECRDVAVETYSLDYIEYYDARIDSTYRNMFPPRPRHYSAFSIISMIISTICALLGLLFIVSGVIIMIETMAPTAVAVAGMYLLYGTLAVYFGIRDFITGIRSKRAIACPSDSSDQSDLSE